MSVTELVQEMLEEMGERKLAAKVAKLLAPVEEAAFEVRVATIEGTRGVREMHLNVHGDYYGTLVLELE